MNSRQMASLTVESASVDPMEFWKLNDPPRFPTTIEEWDRIVDLPKRPCLRVVGAHTYDLVINRKARRPVTRTIHKLLANFRSDFDKACEFFQPEQWRLLYYLDQYPLSALSSPSFGAERTFQQLYLLEPPFVAIPHEWTGSADQSVDVLWDLRAYRHDIDADVAKAAWAILAFARALNLEKNEVLQLPWWQVWWIERCIAAYQSSR